MGLFQSVMSTIGVSSVVTPYLGKAAKWVANSEFGQSIKESVKNVVDDYVGDYASRIESDKWTEMIMERTNLEGLSEEQLESYSNLADSFSNALSGMEDDKWANIKTSISENKEKWGVYLANHGVTDEKIVEIAANKDISGYDIIKLTWTKSTLAEPEKTAQQDSPTAESSSDKAEEATASNGIKDYIIKALPKPIENAIETAEELGIV